MASSVLVFLTLCYTKNKGIHGMDMYNSLEILSHLAISPYNTSFKLYLDSAAIHYNNASVAVYFRGCKYNGVTTLGRNIGQDPLGRME